MKIRGVRWPFIIGFLMIIAFIERSFGNTNPTPLLTHKDAADQREFQNVYQNINAKPSTTIGAGAPTFAPRNFGDIFISTTTSKIYIATGTANSGSWAVIN